MGCGKKEQRFSGREMGKFSEKLSRETDGARKGIRKGEARLGSRVII
jgi:hypothetical protein